MGKFRLITRGDFDGVVCASLFQEMDMIDEIIFVHPKDMQDGKVPVTDNDITANLPYVPGVHLAFDHHASELDRIDGAPENHVFNPHSPSAARVIYDHYGKDKFPNIPEELMTAVDKADSADFTEEEVKNPRDWVLLNFITDPRTGLCSTHNFAASKNEFLLNIIYQVRTQTINDILDSPDVLERIELYFSHEEKFKEQLRRCTTVHKNLAVIDLRNEEITFCGNRFMVYALFPECNISMQILLTEDKQHTIFAVGKSIFNQTSKTDVGKLMLELGGGGHVRAGTCRTANALFDGTQKLLIRRITEDG